EGDRGAGVPGRRLRVARVVVLLDRSGVAALLDESGVVVRRRAALEDGHVLRVRLTAGRGFDQAVVGHAGAPPWGRSWWRANERPARHDIVTTSHRPRRDAVMTEGGTLQWRPPGVRPRHRLVEGGQRGRVHGSGAGA